MTPLDEEWNFLRAVADELPDYLLSNAPTWLLQGQPSSPPLTPGMILLYSARLSGWPWPEEEQIKLEQILVQIDRIRLQWKSAWRERVRMEFPQRLRLWQSYLEEIKEDQQKHNPELKNRIRIRVILELLADQVESPILPDARMMDRLDRMLKQLFQPGPFLWENELKRKFSADIYWYLYLSPSRTG